MPDAKIKYNHLCGENINHHLPHTKISCSLATSHEYPNHIKPLWNTTLLYPHNTCWSGSPIATFFWITCTASFSCVHCTSERTTPQRAMWSPLNDGLVGTLAPKQWDFTRRSGFVWDQKRGYHMISWRSVDENNPWFFWTHTRRKWGVYDGMYMMGIRMGW